MSVAAPSILLADDDDVGRYVIATMLRRAGFTVRRGRRRARRGRRRSQSTPPDLAVLDVKMPGLDGFEACRRIKSDEATRHIPVLMLSATFLETEAQVEGLETGADALPDAAGRGAGAGGDDPLAAALAQPRGRGPASPPPSGAPRSTRSATPSPCWTPTGVVLRANPAFLAAFGGRRRRLAAGGARRGAARAASCSSASGRYSVRLDLVPGSQRLVVTLSDITAARQTERERAAALARERAISRTLQQTLLPERLPSDARLALHAWHLAAEQELIVGGDWYDVIETREGVWLVIGRRRRARRGRRRAGRAAAPLACASTRTRGSGSRSRCPA